MARFPHAQAFRRAPRVPRRTTPRVPLQAVACPDCAAAEGTPCLSSRGLVMPAGHRSRQRLAVRASRA